MVFSSLLFDSKPKIISSSTSSNKESKCHPQILTTISLIAIQLLYINNIDAGTNNAGTYFSEGDSANFKFDELHITLKATLHLRGSESTLTAKRLICDQSTTIYIPDKFNLTVDDGLERTILPCSFKISREGELRLPQQVTFLGAGNDFGGKNLKF